MIRCITFFALVGLLGCARGDMRIAVVPAPADEGGWRVSKETAADILSHTRIALIEVSAKSSSAYRKGEIEKILAHWDEYSCQVIGHERDGKKAVRLAFFPTESLRRGSFRDWREREINVKDGGFWYWSIEYDIDRHVFFDFRSNGYA